MRGIRVDGTHQAALLAKYTKRHLTDEIRIIERQVEQINNDDTCMKTLQPQRATMTSYPSLNTYSGAVRLRVIVP